MFAALQQTHNTQGLVMEVKVTNFSQGYVICERKGEERIKDLFLWNKALSLIQKGWDEQMLST